MLHPDTLQVVRCKAEAPQIAIDSLPGSQASRRMASPAGSPASPGSSLQVTWDCRSHGARQVTQSHKSQGSHTQLHVSLSASSLSLRHV